MSINETWTTTYVGTGLPESYPFNHGIGSSPCAVIIKNGGSSSLSTTGATLTTNASSTNAWLKQDISAHGITVDGNAKISGDAEIEGDLKVRGESITQLLEDIKDRLAILRPNEDLESRWEELRELRRQYMEMEKDILEKEEILRILKE